MTIDRIGSSGEFEKLRPEWTDLLESSRSKSIFLTWEWLGAWWKHCGAGRKLHLLAVRHHGKLAAIAPLVERPRSLARLIPFRALEFAGVGAAGSDYLDIVAHPDAEIEAADAIANYLHHQNMVLECPQVLEDSYTRRLLRPRLQERGWKLSETRSNVCPVIGLAGHSWDSYLKSLGSSHRYNFGRRLKNMRKMFRVSLERAASESQRRDALHTLVELHNMRWLERGGSDALGSPSLLSFHEEWTRLALEQDWLRLFVLTLDGKPAASLYGLKYGSVFYFYQSGFNPEYSRYSAGLVIMGMVIESAIAESAEEFDLLHGGEAYKALWSSNSRDLLRLELYPPRAAALFCERTMMFRRMAGRMIRECF